MSLQVLFRFFIKFLGILKYLSSNLEEKTIWINIPKYLLLHISTTRAPVHSVIPVVLKKLFLNQIQYNRIVNLTSHEIVWTV